MITVVSRHDFNNTDHYDHRPGTALDAVALDRATSIYLVDGVVPMLPRLLCEELCSLTPGAPHLTFSIIWRLAPVRISEHSPKTSHPRLYTSDLVACPLHPTPAVVHPYCS